MESERPIEKEAIGVVCCITPWNASLQVNLAKIIPALLAGCSVVLKPAPDTPWAATLIGNAAHHTDIPAGIINIVPSIPQKQLGQLLMTVCGDFLHRFNEHRTGNHVDAATVKKVFLELGGKSANIILDDGFQPVISSCRLFPWDGMCNSDTASRSGNRQNEVEEILMNYFKMIDYGGDTQTPTLWAL